MTARSALVITASDGVVAGTRTADSGERVSGRLVALGFSVERALVRDDRLAIEAALIEGADRHTLVVTTGGRIVGAASGVDR